MSSIAILGIFVADTTYRAQRLPLMGETLLGNSFVLGPGGKGSNQAVAAARAGGRVDFITRLGADAFGELARDIWAKAGVSAHVTIDRDSYTGAACIFVQEDTGNNAIIVAPGAAGRIDDTDIEANADLIRGACVFLTQLEQPLAPARRGLEIARNAGVMTILNPAPAAPLDAALLALCDIVTPNETEAEALTGIKVETLDQADLAAQALLAKGVKAAIITLGARGVYYRAGDTALHVPAITAGPVVETTGAGDAFNGGLAVALSEGATIEQALRFGCATAGISVTRAGAAASMPTRDEIAALLAHGPR